MKEEELVGINIHKPCYEIHYSSLKKLTDGAFRRQCPYCELGILPTRRDLKTGEFLEHDMCLLCGQQVRYKDKIK